MAKKNAVRVNFTEARDQLKVTKGFSLADIPTDAMPGFKGDDDDYREVGEALFSFRDEELADLQERMYAQSRAGVENAPSVLVVLQGMDASGKGGIVRHVFGSVDPQGLQLASFKKPTKEELEHDFLWRIRKKLPDPGFIGVFDRSHYEDVLVQRVHGMAPPEEIERRYGAIVDFERELTERGTKVLKFMLHVGRDEQAERLLERIERPDKHWKYSSGDIDERGHWEEYAEAFQVALERTSTEESPWWVVPSDRKWYARLLVKSVLLQSLRDMNLEWPVIDLDADLEKQRLADS